VFRGATPGRSLRDVGGGKCPQRVVARVSFSAKYLKLSKGLDSWKSKNAPGYGMGGSHSRNLPSYERPGGGGQARLERGVGVLELQHTGRSSEISMYDVNDPHAERYHSASSQRGCQRPRLNETHSMPALKQRGQEKPKKAFGKAVHDIILMTLSHSHNWFRGNWRTSSIDGSRRG
jgi:hypothetical protein